MQPVSNTAASDNPHAVRALLGLKNCIGVLLLSFRPAKLVRVSQGRDKGARRSEQPKTGQDELDAHEEPHMVTGDHGHGS